MSGDGLKKQVTQTGGIKEALAQHQQEITTLATLSKSGIKFRGETRQGLFDIYATIRAAIDSKMQQIRNSGQQPTPEDIALITDIHEAVKPLLGDMIRAAEFKGQTIWAGEAYGHPDRAKNLGIQADREGNEKP